MFPKIFSLCFFKLTAPILAFVLLCGITHAKDGKKDELVVRIEQNQGIREIAKKYLGDPNLWEDLLYANGLRSHELRPGMKLRIPVKDISGAIRKLEESNESISRANIAGAIIFAPEVISEAIELRNSAIEKRKAGLWSECGDLAGSALKKAVEAMKICDTKKNVPAEAILDNLKGEVHRQKPSDNIWHDVSRNQILMEGEKIRTMSQSYADILFRDSSRLHLKENAQALIRRMRSNLLDETEEAKVSLIEGDVLALLAGGAKEKRVQVDIPGVDAKIDSQSFYVGMDKDGARFANYDDGKMEITSGGKKVVLEENQGSIVPVDQSPTAPRKLLPAPRPLKPENGANRFDPDTPFSWTGVKNADHYLLELALDAAFSNVVLRENLRRTTFKLPKNIGSGSYYWKVSAVSRDQLPGRPGGVRFFRIMPDDNPPFLVVRSPAEGAILLGETAEISGATELGASLFIQEQPVEISLEGGFRFCHELSPGKNSIVVRAVDRAGNVSEIKRVVHRLKKKEIELAFDEHLHRMGRDGFLVAHKDFTLSGKTEPLSQITVSSEESDFSAATNVKKNGKFRINVSVKNKKETITAQVVSRAGNSIEKRFRVEVDDKAPEISFSGEIPSVYGKKFLRVNGNVEDGDVLEINGRGIALEDGGFADTIDLKPGPNILRIVSLDRVGNEAVVEKQIFLDQEAPQPVSHEISPRMTKGKQQARVVLKARDATGFVKAVPYTVEIGKFRQSGLLILSGADGRYTGSFQIPGGVRGRLKLSSVTLSDYVGNSKEYRY